MENKRIIRDNLLFSLKKLIHTMETARKEF